MIGGSSNINAMIYSQGNSEDYQRWYDAGNKEWTVEDIRRCFKKAENFQDENLNKIPDIREHYGQDGLLVINTFNHTNRENTLQVLKAWDEIGFETVLDLNVANSFGSGISRATASNGERNSLSKTYLYPTRGTQAEIDIIIDSGRKHLRRTGRISLLIGGFGREVERTFLSSGPLKKDLKESENEALTICCDKFDFIIVGAGSSGCVLANRLSEVKDWNILLIEAGGDPPIEANIPGFHHDLHPTKYNWGYTTVDNGITNQANINGSIDWPRGKMIGGSSNINGIVYSQGSDEDYQRWFDAGNSEWSVDHVRRCFRKSVSLQDMNLLKNPDIKRHYGHNGPLVINTFNSTQRQNTLEVLSAYDEIGIKTVPDMNVANAFGSGIERVTASDGERNSVSKAYLQPIKHRKNLKIMKNTLALKVLINSRKIAYGVQVETKGKKIDIFATKEVILSAGSINSPQLLMLSGVGPEKHLRSKKIPVVFNSPNVGQNLKDHILQPLTIYTNEPRSVTEADMQFDVIKYFYNRAGYLAQQNAFYDILAFNSLNKNAKYPDFQTFVKKSMKNMTSLKSFLISNNNYKEEVAESIAELNKKYSLYTFEISLLHPHSVGNISLNTNDPKDFPLIYSNYFSDPRDLELLLSGIEKLLEILNTTFFKSVKGFLGRIKWPECDKFKVGSRDYLKCICINLVGTVYHPVGTCKMGSNVSNSVVSSRLKVHGVKNLRVVDASVMPNHISGNTNGACVMIGERAAELIKEDHKKV
ncbi:ecdysone oxidase-like [Anticarsia gemmatalis]|uniref:ecdysone oxidase-like n=1 Tax=Anticarsia gemmatalis TaxID=129554 RepID=UPI003F775F27